MHNATPEEDDNTPRDVIVRALEGYAPVRVHDEWGWIALRPGEDGVGIAADGILGNLHDQGFVVMKRSDIEYHIEALTLALDKNDEGHIYGAGGDVCDYLKAILSEREEL